MLASLTIPSPVGPLTLAASGTGLAILWFGDEDLVRISPWLHRWWPGENLLPDSASALLSRTAGQLKEYFAGKRRQFDIPLDLRGTEYQVRVWRYLMTIPYGTTTSYGAMANALGSVARAVGMANGDNPVSIIVPCHRVIGADGTLTGYGGGLPAKKFLLQLEGAWTAELAERQGALFDV